jgi:hypothetical protein
MFCLLTILFFLVAPINALNEHDRVYDFQQLHETERMAISSVARGWSYAFTCSKEHHAALLGYFYVAAQNAHETLAYNDLQMRILRQSKSLATLQDAALKAAMKQLSYDCALLKKLVPSMMRHEEKLTVIENYLEEQQELEVAIDALRDQLFDLTAQCVAQRVAALDELLLQAEDAMNNDTLVHIARVCHELYEQTRDNADATTPLIKLNVLARMRKPLQVHLDELTEISDAFTQATSFTLKIGLCYFVHAYNELSASFYTRYTTAPQITCIDMRDTHLPRTL